MLVPKNERVLLRVDWNIPSLDEVNRVQASLSTIKHLLRERNTIIIATHWGRPEGQRIEEWNVEKLIPIIAQQFKNAGIDTTIIFADQSLNFDAVRNTVRSCGLEKNLVVLLQNTRFLSDEDSSDSLVRSSLAQKYASLATYFIDEAFSLSHRKEATNCEIKLLLPHSFGLQYEKEIEILSKIKKEAQRPFVMCIGGAKLETKLPVIERLLPRVDKLYICGQLVFTFLKAQEKEVYESLVEYKFLEKAKELLARDANKIILMEPEYVEVGGKVVGVDTAKQHLVELTDVFKNARTIFWNGCVGWVEKGFVHGNRTLARIIADSHAYTVVGGGDTVGSIEPGLLQKIDFVSTGGGASLAFLAE